MSTISTLAVELHHVIKTHGIEIKRSHLHEIISALFGFKTFNSLKLSSYPLFTDSIDDQLDIELFQKRCQELNISFALAPVIQKHISDYHLLYLTDEKISELVRAALDDDLLQNDVLERLKKTFIDFSKFSIYPYLIAQFYSDCENNFDERNTDMHYLYQRYLQGKEISPTWKPSLDYFIKEIERNDEYKENYMMYLKKAAELGSFPAQLQLYQFENNNHYFEEDTGHYIYSTYAPNIELALAKRGDKECLREIFDRIVYCGNYEEIKELTEDELIEAWKWQKFAEYLGYDLAKGNYKTTAIYDQGNIFAAESGRHDVNLSKLTLEQENIVNQEVKNLIKFYENLNEFTFSRYLNHSSYVDWDGEDDFNWEDD
ncbi:hypothetical protein [Acinetobacter sp. ANC 4862]|uniref:hypothetical protein n=1 Tax=Acinetobacter sp. ANC 4862 TaxID=2529849 RepID=UPI0020777451|nr:hypothetical protein [Acinetobacter sp. ANC 4862]